MTRLYSPAAVRPQDADFYATRTPETLRDLFLFGTGFSLGRNLVIGSEHAAVVGTPTIGTNYARFQGLVAFLQTVITEDPLGETFYVVCRSLDTGADAAHRPQFFGSGPAPAAEDGLTSIPGVGMYWTGAIVSAAATRGVNLAGAGTGLAGFDRDISAWALYEIRIIPGSYTWITDLTGGGTTDNNSTSAARILSLGAYRIGSGYDSNYAGQCDIHSWWRHTGPLSGDAQAAARLDARQEALWAGLTV